jgi:hypothetical protein
VEVAGAEGVHQEQTPAEEEEVVVAGPSFRASACGIANKGWNRGGVRGYVN